MSEINESNFNELIIDSRKVALIAFVAKWCKPSMLQVKVIDSLKEKYKDSCEIYTIDVDEEEQLADKFNARTLPTVVLFALGEIVECLAGYQPEDFLASYIEHLKDSVKKHETSADK